MSEQRPLSSKKMQADHNPENQEREPSSDSPFDEPVVIPITGILDLHTIRPRDAEAAVEEYLHECYRQNVGEIRLIHGKGIGFQREMVRKVLERLDFVHSFGDAPAEAGGWGATLVTLRRNEEMGPGAASPPTGSC
jgi:dsDNA-specific endonuclease/ATPase MutS2